MIWVAKLNAAMSFSARSAKGLFYALACRKTTNKIKRTNACTMIPTRFKKTAIKMQRIFLYMMTISQK